MQRMPESLPLPSYPANRCALPAMVAAVGSACEASALPRALRLRIELVVEELVANTLAHGYREAAEGKHIWMRVSTDPDGVSLSYQDEGPPFNPLAAGPDSAERAVRSGRPGGVGGAIIGALPVEARYARIDGRNALELRFPLT